MQLRAQVPHQFEEATAALVLDRDHGIIDATQASSGPMPYSPFIPKAGAAWYCGSVRILDHVSPKSCADIGLPKPASNASGVTPLRRA